MWEGQMVIVISSVIAQTGTEILSIGRPRCVPLPRRWICISISSNYQVVELICSLALESSKIEPTYPRESVLFQRDIINLLNDMDCPAISDGM